ncbi:hypothetical protein YC2023_015050 [Brassica napus]
MMSMKCVCREEKRRYRELIIRYQIPKVCLQIIDQDSKSLLNANSLPLPCAYNLLGRTRVLRVDRTPLSKQLHRNLPYQNESTTSHHFILQTEYLTPKNDQQCLQKTHCS